MEDNKCQVCGKTSGKYPICIACNKLKNSGGVQKCETCGKWYKTEEGCCEKTQEANDTCIVCGAEAKSGPLCIDCYKEKESVKKEFIGNRHAQEIKDHYFAQRRMLYRIKNPEYVMKGTIRLIAISEELKLYHKDNYLKDRLAKDIENLTKYANERKEHTENDTNTKRATFDDEDYRKQWPAEHQCDDGHYVRSYSEMLIDNWLYNSKIVHAYEKSVFMVSEPDAVVLSDFYIPEGNVYIEFWGLNDDQNYLERKEKKIKLYEGNKLNLISLEENDVKRLNDIMPRKLHEFLKNKNF